MSAVNKRVTTVIDGVVFELHENTKFVMQDRNGIWYQHYRNPNIYIDEETKQQVDWTTAKFPIITKSDEGWPRPVQTAVISPWQQTKRRAIIASELPQETCCRI